MTTMTAPSSVDVEDRPPLELLPLCSARMTLDSNGDRLHARCRLQRHDRDSEHDWTPA